MVGLLLVPVGALRVASAYWSRLAARQYGIAIVALVTSSVVWGLSVWEDYLPGVIGIKEYHYEPAGDALAVEHRRTIYAVRDAPHP